jgi:hypothetical protein
MMSEPAPPTSTVSISKAALIWALIGVVVLALVAALIGGWVGASAATPEPTPTPTATPEETDAPLLDDEQRAALEAAIADILPVGSAVRVGTGVPPEDGGQVGDVYINTTNSDVYVRRDSGWERVGNLRVDMAENLTGPEGPPGAPGDTGAEGTPGTDGTQVVLGTEAPEADAVCAPDGSVFIDTTTSTYYSCIEGVWTLFGEPVDGEGTDTEG